MTRKTKPWHEREHYQHGEVDGTGYSVSAGQVLAECLTLKGNYEPQFRADDKRQCQEADEKGAATRTNCWELTQHITRSQENDDCHERHFRQFGPTHADTWNQKRNSNDAEQEPRAKYEGEVDEDSTNDA